MREILNSGAVGSIELDAQKKIRQDIFERWERLGLTEGLQGHLSETISTLYENQAKHLIYEATASDNSGAFETVVFPLIRRVFSKLLANDIVSVQAMNLPIGKLFFIKPVTSERQWDEGAFELEDGKQGRHVGLMGYERANRFYDAEKPESKETVNRYYLPDEVVKSAGDDDPQLTKYMKKSLYDLFYDDFLFDNSKGKVTIRVGKCTPVVLDADGKMSEIKLEEVSFAPESSVDSLILEVSGFSSYNAGKLTGPDGNEMDTEAFLASLKVVYCGEAPIDGENGEFASFDPKESIPFRIMTQKYGAGIVDYFNEGPNKVPCDVNGKLYIELDLTKPCAKAGKTINGYIGISGKEAEKLVKSFQAETADALKIAWAQYDSLELETEMGEVSFQLTSVTVSVEERKLRSTWSPELAQDVAAFQNIDAEAELTAILSEQIAAEIDREILRDLRKSAPWQLRWDYNGWQRLGTQSVVYTQKDWNQTLMTAINKISSQIQKSTLRGGANFIVVSAEISAVLNDLEYFHVTDANPEADRYNMGIEKIGSLQGRYQVIVDPYAPHWSLIMGHNGSSLLDTGYIYAPYVPMALTPTMYNPFNFAPIKGIVTRYAKKLINNKYYGAIKCDGLVHWNTSELR